MIFACFLHSYFSVAKWNNEKSLPVISLQHLGNKNAPNERELNIDASPLANAISYQGSVWQKALALGSFFHLEVIFYSKANWNKHNRSKLLSSIPIIAETTSILSPRACVCVCVCTQKSTNLNQDYDETALCCGGTKDCRFLQGIRHPTSSCTRAHAGRKGLQPPALNTIMITFQARTAPCSGF